MNTIAKNPVYRKRLLAHRVGIVLSVIAMAIGLGFLFWILATLLINGFGAISSLLFTADTPAPGSEGGGLRNAIMGSVMMVGLSTLVSTPIGILAGIYLAEYGDNNKFASVTRFVTDIMLSAPSIVIGLFVYAIYVANVQHFSGYAGTIALSLIAVPVVVRTTDNMLRLVPNSLLALARISGETAPLLFTALNNQFYSTDMNAPMANLPVVIFQFAMSPYDDWRSLAWGGALLVTFTVLLLNILSRTLFSQKTPR